MACLSLKELWGSTPWKPGGCCTKSPQHELPPLTEDELLGTVRFMTKVLEMMMFSSESDTFYGGPPCPLWGD